MIIALRHIYYYLTSYNYRVHMAIIDLKEKMSENI